MGPVQPASTPPLARLQNFKFGTRNLAWLPLTLHAGTIFVALENYSGRENQIQKLLPRHTFPNEGDGL